MSTHSDEETRRFDALDDEHQRILERISGAELDAALEGNVRRLGKSDADMRIAAINTVHPDDREEALAKYRIVDRSQLSMLR